MPGGRTGRVVAAALVLGASVLTAAPAAAQTDGREITRYAADIRVGPDGVADVALEFDFDFGDEPGHGPFLTLPTRQDIAGDDERDRLFRIADVTASSETAPDDLDVESDWSGLVVRVGDEDVDDVAGVHTYSVTYRVEGWVNPAGTVLGDGRGAAPEGDELFVDVIGTDWEIPLSDVSATVTGPADVVEALCFAGRPGSDDPCTAAPEVVDSASGDASVTFTHDVVRPGEAFTVVAAWPAGTFPGVRPILGETIDLLDPLRPTTPVGAAGIVLLLGGGAYAVVRARRGGRDREALGLGAGGPGAAGAPGVVPGMTADGAAAPTGFHGHRPPVAIQSTPPAGVLPGELGTLLDEVADPRDVTATIVDLAVRGYLEIHEEGLGGGAGPDDGDGAGSDDGAGPGDGAADWELVATDRPRADLTAFERKLLEDLFAKRRSVRMSDVRTTFASSMAAVQALLYEHVTERGWFRANPRTVRNHWYTAGALLLVAGVVAGIVAFAALVDGLALVGLALLVLGILVVVLAGAAPARTSSGTALLAEAVAFKRYLETADADRLRAVHGEDLFSRYLPYAIVFGLTERWAGVFGDLAAQGERVPEPTWYHGYGYGTAPYLYWGAGSSFGSDVDSFASTTTESIAAATPSSSGSSGTSGGFAGGGVGGGGGGGW